MRYRNSVFQFFLSFYHRADSALNHLFSERGNFLYYLGALPVILLFVLLITGLFMFIYYNMSVTQSYESVKYMTESALFGRFVRNLHRYAADAMMFFVILHLARMLFEEKFQNHRALAWVSGLVILGFMLVQGVTGYILPLDTNARYVMEKTSEVLAGLRVFGDTLPRSFSSPALLGKWIMWVVLIIHLIIPLFFLLLLFVHLLRVSRAKIFPPRRITWIFLAVLALYTLVFPLSMAGKADAEKMAELAQPDWFYLFFAAIFSTRFGWIAWSAMAFVFIVLVALPWIFKRREIFTAAVLPDKCTGCGLCATDCPYQAMHMIERISAAGETTHKYLVAIDTDLCSGCGICAGSCTYGAITHVKTPQVDWLAARDKWVTLVCEGRADALESLPPLENTMVHTMPCTGKLGVTMAEEIRLAGAKGIIVGACPDGDCWYREGNRWLMDRLELKRKPNFRRVPEEFPVIGYRFNGRQKKDFAGEIRRITGGVVSLPKRFFALLKPGNWLHSFSVSTVVFSLLLWIFYLGSSGRFGAIYPAAGIATLRLDFFYQTEKETCSPEKIPANAREEAIQRMAGLVKLDNLTPEARERILQQATESVAAKYCSRARLALNIIVRVDGREAARHLFKPAGLKNDGITYVMAKTQTTPGGHTVEIDVQEQDGKLTRFSDKLVFTAAEVKLIDYEPNQSKLYLRTLKPAAVSETGKE